MSDRTLEEIVREAQYAREHAVGAAALPSVLVEWVQRMADDIEALAARIEADDG